MGQGGGGLPGMGLLQMTMNAFKGDKSSGGGGGGGTPFDQVHTPPAGGGGAGNPVPSVTPLPGYSGGFGIPQFGRMSPDDLAAFNEASGTFAGRNRPTTPLPTAAKRGG